MGSCISTTTQSSNGDLISSSHIGSKLHEQKRTKKSNSNQIIDLQHLGSVPNRICSNGKSRSSCIFTRQGRKGINQDAMIVWEDFISDDVTFLGVFDGHGPYGHLIARRVRDVLPLKLLSYYHSLRSRQTRSKPTFLRGSLKKSKAADSTTSFEDKLDCLWKEAFLKSYKLMDKELRSLANLDCFCSGSTAVTMVKQGTTLFLANIGDSRAILGSKDDNGFMLAVQLTVDLKPDLPKEAERIKQKKGRVFAMRDEPDVSRVWLPYDDAPGLAMARAFGDFCLKNYGVISVPEFSRRDLTERDQFVIIASDGVWDVLSNEEVVAIVSSSQARSSAARLVVDAAAREWKLKYPTSRIDDCAVVCLYLDGKMDPEFNHDENGFYSAATFHSNPYLKKGEPNMSQSTAPTLRRNYTVRSSSEDDVIDRDPSVERKGNNETGLADDRTWSGLEGVTRVNSLVQLPRFSGERPDS
ncbi:unnamed protein product [Rhodiola kirilowii]